MRTGIGEDQAEYEQRSECVNDKERRLLSILLPEQVEEEAKDLRSHPFLSRVL